MLCCALLRPAAKVHKNVLLSRLERAEPLPACAGKGKEVRLLTAPQPTQRITYHPHSTPLHRIRTENMLPTELLTPFQARRVRYAWAVLYVNLDERPIQISLPVPCVNIWRAPRPHAWGSLLCGTTCPLPRRL